MICLICGKENISGIICKNCESKVSEDICFGIAGFNAEEANNQLWSEISCEMDKPYLFRDYSIQLADYLDGQRTLFVKMKCMNIINTNALGVSSKWRGFVIENAMQCCNTEVLDREEKWFITALLTNAYIMQHDWDNVAQLLEKIKLGECYVEPYLIMSDYYMKIRDYNKSLDIIIKARDVFGNEAIQERISNQISEVTERKNGNKSDYKPSKRADIEKFYKYLDTLGIQHCTLSNDKKNKVKQTDFKSVRRYTCEQLPTEYVAFWITTEFHQKRKEPVEISGIKVCNGKIKERYHSFLKPTRTPKVWKYVREEDCINALPISSVFPDFLKFADGGILASLGFDDQNDMLSVLARYSSMEEITNSILDVLEYYDDHSDDFEMYTRESLLNKYGITEGTSGEQKAEITFELIEKLRQVWT